MHPSNMTEKELLRQAADSDLCAAMQNMLRHKIDVIENFKDHMGEFSLRFQEASDSILYAIEFFGEDE